MAHDKDDKGSNEELRKENKGEALLMKITAKEMTQLEGKVKELKPVTPRCEMAEKKLTDLDHKYLEVIASAKSLAVSEIAKGVGQNRNTVAWRLTRLRRMGKIGRVNDDKNGVANLYFIARA